jgi:hypothetical protein
LIVSGLLVEHANQGYDLNSNAEDFLKGLLRHGSGLIKFSNITDKALNWVRGLVAGEFWLTLFQYNIISFHTVNIYKKSVEKFLRPRSTASPWNMIFHIFHL